MRLGLGFRDELGGWIDAHAEKVECLEITAEHFFDDRGSRLKELARRFPLFVHGLGLSLGTPGRLDPHRLERYAHVAETAGAEWVSEHIAFTRTPNVDLGHLNPVPPNRSNARLIADHAREISDRCGKPILLENITSYLHLRGDLRETEFLNEICHRANCGLLLDVTNLFVNARNHRFDPIQWLHEIEPRFIAQLHLVGYSRRGSRFTDSHGEAIQEEVLQLAREVIRHGSVEAVILERDQNFDSAEAITAEFAKLEALRAER